MRNENKMANDEDESFFLRMAIDKVLHFYPNITREDIRKKAVQLISALDDLNEGEGSFPFWIELLVRYVISVKFNLEFYDSEEES